MVKKKEMVTPTPAKSADGNNGEFTQPVYNSKDNIVRENQQTGTRTRFSFSNEDVSAKRNKK